MPEQILKYFWVVTLVFVAGVAFLSARLTSVFVARELWVAEAESAPTEAQRTAPVERERLADYEVIQTRNVFNANPKPPEPELPVEPAAEEAAPEPPPVRRTPLNLTLIGTAVRGGEASFAIVQMGSETKLVRQGEELAPNAVLTEVRRDRILVDNAGVTEEFLLFPPENQAGRRAPRVAVRRPPPPPEPETSSDTVRQVGEGSWLIDSREVEQATENMSQLMTQIRVVPNFTDGQPDGFKVFAIRPGSLFSKIGLQNGDVVKRINGLEIQGPDEAFRAYQQLQNETSIQIDLVRRGENQTFNYEIR